MVANELRRDGPNSFDNDNFAVILDTFRDRRNGFMFQTNPLGAVNDQLMTDEGAVSNRDWNTVWDLRTSRDRRLVGGDGHPVRLAAVPAGPGADLGYQLPAQPAGENGIHLPRADPRLCGPAGPRRACRWPPRWSASRSRSRFATSR